MADSTSTFSESWYRVANQRLCLRPGVRVRRQNFRGERWFVLENPFTNEYFRIRPEAYPADGNALLLRLDFLPAPGFDRDEIFPPAPNPSAGPVFIPLALAQYGSARVELFDLHGRLLYMRETDLPAGPQRLEIPREAFRGRERVLAYRVRAGEATACGKIVRQ